MPWGSWEAHLSCRAQGAEPKGATGSVQGAETQETQEAFVSFPLCSLLMLHPKRSSPEVNGKHPAALNSSCQFVMKKIPKVVISSNLFGYTFLFLISITSAGIEDK